LNISKRVAQSRAGAYAVTPDNPMPSASLDPAYQYLISIKVVNISTC